MKIASLYTPKIITWDIKDSDLFLGRTDLVTNFGLGLTPPDINDLVHSYFTIEPTMMLKHETNGDVFTYTCQTVFQIENNQVKPTPEFLFEVVIVSVQVANQLMDKRKEKTMIMGKTFPEPIYNHVYPDLIQSILLAYRD